MFIAADTSPLVALSAIGRLDLLRRACDKVWLPPTVVKELITDGNGWLDAAQAQEEFEKGEWLLPWKGEMSLLDSTSRKLGRGEIEAVSLAFAMKGSCFIDERRGRGFATSHRVVPIGSLAILCRSKREGIIGEIKPYLTEMIRKGNRYAPELIAEVLADMNE